MATRKTASKPASKANVSKDELLDYYRDMLLIRRFEEKAGQLYGMGLIGGFCHLYIGQEAVVVGHHVTLGRAVVPTVGVEDAFADQALTIAKEHVLQGRGAGLVLADVEDDPHERALEATRRARAPARRAPR